MAQLTGTPPSLTYVPNGCFAGADRLTFRVRDGQLDSEVATVDIYVGEDCNRNGVADSLDIANGTSQDCNGNGVPDECDVAIKGRGFTDLASWSAYDPGAHGVGRGSGRLCGWRVRRALRVFRAVFQRLGLQRRGIASTTRWPSSTLPKHGRRTTCPRTVWAGSARVLGAVFDGRYVYFVPGPAAVKSQGMTRRVSLQRGRHGPCTARSKLASSAFRLDTCALCSTDGTSTSSRM